MFDVASLFISQLIDFLPYLIGLFLIFDFVGSLLFKSNQEDFMFRKIYIKILSIVAAKSTQKLIELGYFTDDYVVLDSNFWSDYNE